MIFLNVFDTVVGVRIAGRSREDIEIAMQDTWNWGWISGPVDDHDLMISGSIRGQDLYPTEVTVMARDLESLLRRLTSRIVHDAMEAQAGRLTMISASAVAHPASGETIAFVGGKGSGKTNMALSLGHSYGFVADDVVAIRADNSVVPFARPLSLEHEFGMLPSGETPIDLVSPTNFWLETPPKEPAIRSVVFLDRQQDFTGTPYLTELEPLEGILELSGEVTYLNELRLPLHRLGSIVDQCGGIHRLTYRQAHDALPLVAELIGAAA